MSVLWVGILALAGCTQTLRSTVTAFSLQAPVSGSVQVVPAPSVEVGSLEFAHYKAQFEQRLINAGFEVETKSAQYQVVLGYGVEEVTQENDWESAFWLRSGYSRQSFARGGAVVQVPEQKRQFKRTLKVVVQEAGSKQRLYEASVVSVGACDVFTVVFDEMAGAFFEVYPAANGSIQTVSIAGDLRCR